MGFSVQTKTGRRKDTTFRYAYAVSVQLVRAPKLTLHK